MNKLKVLVLGYGSREHALTWKISQSPCVSQIFVAPGNAGTAQIATNIDINDEDVDTLLAFALQEQIDLTVVGTNDPLALGVVDAFQAAGLAIFGPTQAAAQLESSKAFAKAFMQRHNIATPAYRAFTDYNEALSYLMNETTGRVVIKVSGLGKWGMGVTVCDNLMQAKATLNTYMLDRVLGESADIVIIEERIEGPEVSVFALSDGKNIVPLAPVQDHKRIYDGDEGPNTGGIAAFAPPPNLDADFMDTVTDTILQPTIDGMAAEGTPYVGVLFAGLMLTDQGIQVLEFNCRFGNPEALVLVSLLKTDLVEAMQACIIGTLTDDCVQLHDRAAAAVVMTSPQYPGTFPTGLPISGIERASRIPDVTIFHHGTQQDNGRLVTSRGRVLGVTAIGDDLAHALNHVYKGIGKIDFEGAHYRQDIGKTYRSSSRPNNRAE
ncbi:MAG: phosphoribosylamine--glycine ligase [Chloroflexota bacterium]